MNETLRKSISYSLNFLSFVFLETGVQKKILSAYLFGSAVREELDKESDIDIFINCEKEDETFLIKSCESARKKFIESKDFDKWKRLEFNYPISLKAGPISEWQLKTSIESEGIELYSKSITSQDIERLVLFSIDLPQNKKAYLKIKRELFGRTEKDFKSEGLVSKSKGKQLASGIFIIPKLEQTKFIDVLNSNKIKFSMMEILKQKI